MGGLGRTTDDYWGRRAGTFHKFVQEWRTTTDPFLESVLRHVQPTDVVLDVGAGTGRHSVPLAGHAQRVVAVDPSPAMLRFLRESAAEEARTNIDVIEGAWPDVAEQAPKADVVISAHVVYPIEDIVPFLQALDAKATRVCLLNLMVWQPWFDRLGLWEAVHGQARLPQPAHMDVVNVLAQLGCYANVEIAWLDLGRTFASMDAAVEGFAEAVAAGDDRERQQRLRDALALLLEPRPDGAFAYPQRRYPTATVWWEAGALS
jgi:SAM-dependent methyltransferase